MASPANSRGLGSRTLSAARSKRLRQRLEVHPSSFQALEASRSLYAGLWDVSVVGFHLAPLEDATSPGDFYIAHENLPGPCASCPRRHSPGIRIVGRRS